jgi:tight adherence protein C
VSGFFLCQKNREHQVLNGRNALKSVVIFTSLSVFLWLLCLGMPISNRLRRKTERLQALSGQRKDFLSEELHLPFTRRFLQPLLKQVFGAFGNFRRARQKDSKKLDHLSLRLKMAGLTISAHDYRTAVLFVQFTGLLLFAAASRFLLIVRPLIGLLILLFVLIISLLGPKYYLDKKITKRRDAIRKELPDVLDLLVVSVEAGLGLDSAIVRLGEEKKTPLIGELLLTIRDVSMGISRKAASKALSERTDVAELKLFINSLLQAEQLGVSVKSVLSAQATQLRQARKQMLEAKAMKAPVKMMLPTVVFIFPVLFIILLAPAVLKFMNAF